MPEAEEVFDLIFYRPLAYLLVMGLSVTSITPNQVTILSLIAGIIAAYHLSLGVTGALFLAALWYALANIFDCADGQLARVKKNGTPLGRLVDGVADYISSVAIFLGIGFGLAAINQSNWWLVIAGGLSSALHAIRFDDVQGRFIARVKGVTDIHAMEREKYSAQIAEYQKKGRKGIKFVFLNLYMGYLTVQQRFQSPQPSVKDQEKTSKSSIIRLWTFLGPTTNRTLLIISALLGNIHIYLWTVLIVGNFWLVVCTILQKRIDKI